MKDITTYPNPWDFDNTDKSLKSKDNRFKIEYYDLNEISMGAPLGGKSFLITEDGKKIKIGDWCAGPAIWDSNYALIAVPIWERKIFKGTIQKLIILNLTNGLIKKYRKSFSVLDIRGFENGVIYAYDSPRHNPKEIEFDTINEKTESESVNQDLILIENKNTEIDLSSNPDDFKLISNILETKLNVRFTKKNNGLDQKYWDFEYRNYILTLHQEHYLGVSIFIKDSEIRIDSKIMIELETEIRKYWH